MSATPSTTPAAPATPAVSRTNLDTGIDLTALDDAALAADLGFEPPPDGGSEPSDVSSAEEDILSAIASEVPADGPTDVDAAVNEASDAEPPADEAEPAKEESVPAEKPARELLAQFQVFDQEGELEIPELFVSFQADGGKPFEKTPLDKVVRLAQQGAYNHRLQQEVQSVRETQARLSDAESTIQQLQSRVEEQVALTERLLTDPDFFEKALDRYSEYHTPEAQLERLRAENERLKRGPTRPSTDDGQQWFEASVMPAVDAIMSQNPTVAGPELLGQFMLLTSGLLVNGKIPPQARARVQEILAAELYPWAQQLHEERSAAAAEREKAAKAAERAKVSATVVKRQLARATKPAGKPAPDKPQSRPAGNADDEAENILSGLFA